MRFIILENKAAPSIIGSISKFFKKYATPSIFGCVRCLRSIRGGKALALPKVLFGILLGLPLIATLFLIFIPEPSQEAQR